MRHIALLRGVNVGKSNRVPMAELRDALGKAGFEHISTYLQSGNVILHSEMSSDDLEKAVNEVVAKEFQLDIPVVARESSELRKILDSNPFGDAPEVAGNLYVTFLKEELAMSKASPVLESDGNDEFHVVGREVFILCKGPYHLTKLSNSYWEKVSGAHATTRGWRTLDRLGSLAAE